MKIFGKLYSLKKTVSKKMGLKSLESAHTAVNLDVKNCPHFRGQIVSVNLSTNDYTREIKDKKTGKTRNVTTPLKTTKLTISPTKNDELYSTGKWYALTVQRLPLDAPQVPVECWCFPIQYKDKSVKDSDWEHNGEFYPISMTGPFVVSISGDHVSKYKNGNFVKLSGVYVEKTKLKPKDGKGGVQAPVEAPVEEKKEVKKDTKEKVGEKRNVDDDNQSKTSENPNKKKKSDDVEITPDPTIPERARKNLREKFGEKKFTKEDLQKEIERLSEEHTKQQLQKHIDEKKKVDQQVIGVVDPEKIVYYRSDQWFYTVRAQDINEDIVPLMDEEDRKNRHVELLVPEITDDNARMMDMKLSAIQRSMSTPIYKNILANDGSDLTLFVPSGNTCVQPFIKRDKDSTDEISTATDNIYSLGYYGLGSANGKFDTMRIDQTSFTQKVEVDGKETTVTKPMLKFLLHHEESLLPEDCIRDKSTGLIHKFARIQFDAVIWNDKVNPLFGMWDNERLVRQTRTFVPDLVISGSSNPVKKDITITTSANDLDVGSPLKSILVSKGQTGGRQLDAGLNISLVQSVLEKSHYEKGLYFPSSGAHLKTLLSLMVDDEILMNAPNGASNLDQKSASQLYLRNLKKVENGEYQPALQLLCPKGVKNLMHLSGSSVVCHREAGTLEPYNGTSHARALIAIDRPEDDHSWKKNNYVQNLFDSIVFGEKNLKAIHHENWKFSNPKLARMHGFTDIPSKEMIAAQNLIVLYHIQFAKIISRFKKTNTKIGNALMDEYAALAKSIHAGIIKEFKIDTKKHPEFVRPNTTNIQRIYDVCCEFEINLFTNNIPLACDVVYMGPSTKEVQEPKRVLEEMKKQEKQLQDIHIEELDAEDEEDGDGEKDKKEDAMEEEEDEEGGEEKSGGDDEEDESDEDEKKKKPTKGKGKKIVEEFDDIDAADLED